MYEIAAILAIACDVLVFLLGKINFVKRDLKLNPGNIELSEQLCGFSF